MNQIEMRVWRQSCHLFAAESPYGSSDLCRIGRVHNKGKLLALAECIGFCIGISRAVGWTVAVLALNLHWVDTCRVLAKPLLRLVHKLMQKLP